MPNGNESITSPEWTKIKAFFHKHSAVLLEFAVAHNVAVDEYYHEQPSWAFRFKHPKGGGASVELERVDDSTVRIHGSWYLDEYETFTRHLKWDVSHDLRLENIDLRKELEANLNKVVSWEKKELTPHDAKYPWSKYSEKEWDQMAANLPLLRP